MHTWYETAVFYQVIQMDNLLTRGHAAIAENSYSFSIATILSDSVS